MENGFTNEQLIKMSYDELCKVKPKNMAENPPVRGIGIPDVVTYNCKFCNQSLEGSERSVSNLSKSKAIICPYCKKILWNPEDKNALRRSAFKPGHFDLERKKRYLKYLTDRAKRK